MKHSYIGIIGSLILCLVLATTPWTHAQAQDPLDTQSAPRIIDLWPTAGATLGIDEPLMITFDQPMQRASVQQAITLQPTVIGDFQWLDAQTITFTPTRGWPRAANLVLTLTKTARSVSGSALDNGATVKFATESGLTVTSISPTKDQANAASKIIVAFDRPVVPLTTAEESTTLRSPFTISPPIPGQGSWMNTSVYVFTPSQPLPGGSTYIITVQAGLTASDGSSLDTPVSSTFTVAPTIVQQVDLKSDSPLCQNELVGLECPLGIAFSEPMDHASAEAAITLSLDDQPVAGRLTWTTDSRSVVFKATQRLKPQRAYHLKIALTAHNLANTGSLGKAEDIVFHTVPLPGIDSTSPDNKEVVPPGGGAYIDFKTPMHGHSFQERVSVSPAPPDLIIRGEPDYGMDTDLTQRLNVEFQALPETTYTITLKAGIEDAYGNKMGQDYAFSFTTTKPPPVEPIVYPLLNGTIMSSGVINGKSTLRVAVRGTVEARFQIFATTTNIFGNTMGNFQFGDYCRGADGTIGYSSDSRPEFGGMNKSPLYDWTEHFTETSDKITLRDVPLPDIKPGFYVVRLIGPKSTRTTFGLSIATANLTMKRTNDQLLVWVTDLVTAKPLANVPVTLYFNKNNGDYGPNAGIDTIPIGSTDANGLIHTPLKLAPALWWGASEQQLYVVARNKQVYGAWYSCLGYFGGLTPTRQSYLYTDRPIYRPGETVYVKGIVRNRHDRTFTPLKRNRAHLELHVGTYGQEQTVVSADTTINERGSLAAEFKLPEDIRLGTATIILSFPEDTEGEVLREQEAASYSYDYFSGRSSLHSVSFEVSAFRPPEFAVAINPVQREIVQGDPLDIDVSATYYAGGPVNNAQAEWKLYAEPFYFSFSGSGRPYSFWDERWPDFYYDDQASGKVRTGEAGATRFTTGNTRLTDQTYYKDDGLGPGGYRTDVASDPAPGKRSVIYIPEATITDQAAQPVSARGQSVTAHAADLYVGVDADRWGAPIGQPLPVSLIALRPNQTPIDGQSVRVTVSRITWRLKPLTSAEGGWRDNYGNPTWYEAIDPVQSGNVTTESDGTATYSFTPPDAGVYRVAVASSDARGRIASATLRMYVWGTTRDVYFNDPLLEMQPVADKQQYKPGETATFNVPLGFNSPSTVLVTVERQGVLTSEVVQANGPILTYKLPLTDSYAPTVFVNFTAYRGVDDVHPQPDYVYGSVKINVEPSARRLKLKVIPSTTNTTPRGKVSFDVEVTDQRGKPVMADVSLALVDKSVLALVEANTTTLEEAFYGEQSYNMTRTGLSMFGYNPRLTGSYIVPCCFGGGGGPRGPLGTLDTNPYVRSNFKFTALWSPFVKTDAGGKAKVTVTLPDNATTWTLDARAVTTTTQVGQGTTELIATLPLLVRPVVPRFFVAGDKVQLAAVINNNSGQDQRATVTLQATGVTLDSSQAQQVTVKQGQRARITWNVTVNADATSADLVFAVLGEDGYQDAARPLIATGPNGTVPVYRYAAYDNVATAGSVLQAGTRTEQISIPARLNATQGQLNIRLDASLAAATLDTLTYLQNYPYDCNEQTVSKLLPNLITLRALKQLNVNDPALEKQLNAVIQTGLSKLSGVQNRDGGWGWYPHMDSDPLVTADVLLAFTEARSQKIGLSQYYDPSSFVAQYLISVDAGTPTWQLNQQAFLEYVTARALLVQQVAPEYLTGKQQEALARLRMLFTYRDRMNIDGRAFLLMALAANMQSKSEIVTLTAELESSAISSATSAHWEDVAPDWYNWGTNTRSTALALNALLTAKPESPLLPNVVRWLMLVRHEDHWETSQETFWSVYALSNWMIHTNELKGRYVYQLRLNQESLLNATISPADVRTSRTLAVDVQKFLVNQASHLVVVRGAGAGALYYTANLKLFLPAAQVKAISRGVHITREYFVADNPRQSITRARLGDTITVRLTFTVDQDMRYFMVEDPLPAGTEGIDVKLLTTSLSAKGPDLDRLDSDYRWWWGWWYIDRTEIRDQQVNLYARTLPRGTYTFSYQIRASVPGEFQAMPARAYPFYTPDIFGRTAGALFTVQP